ncbi:sulfotransferase family 2 domain-containing protein [Rubrivivax sp. JA1055]|nr:sulfotransferase family 2 domain-containing protein [Rubrivivax sp. JA1055]
MNMAAAPLRTRSDLGRLVFLHIPKTGGTTLDHILRQHFLPEEVCPERHAGLESWPPILLPRFNYFSAHDSFESFERYVPKPFRMVTVLREPIDRSISNYLFWRSLTESHIEKNNLHQPRIAKTYQFKDYLKFPVADLRIWTENVMTRHLSHRTMKNEREVWADGDDSEMLDRALANLAKIDVYGISEFMDESVEVICRHFDVAMPVVVPRLNQTNTNHPEKPEFFEKVEDLSIDDETEELLRKLNRLDTVLYNEAVKSFSEKARKDGRRLSGVKSLCGRTVAHFARTVFQAEPGESGFLLFGPYIRLQRGRYTVSVEVRISSLPAGVKDGEEIGFIDVCSGKGGQTHGRQAIRVGEVSSDGFRMLHLDFALARMAMDLEVRAFTSGRCAVCINQDVRLRERA